MRTNTVAMIGGAFVLATAATGLTIGLVGGRGNAKPAPVTVAKPVPKERTVVVAAKALSFGMPLTQDALKEIAWPDGAELPGSFSNVSKLLGERRMVLSHIAAGEPVFETRLTRPGRQATLSALIADGKTAVTVRVDDVLGVAGFVQPGDQVDILLIRTKRSGHNTGSNTDDTFSDTLLQGVRVLAIDQAVAANREVKPAKLATIEVSLEQAQKVALAAKVGQLSLALRGTGSKGVAESRRIGMSDLPHESGDVAVRSVSEPAIIVTRGVERRRYDVPRDGQPTDRQPLAHELNGSPLNMAADGHMKPKAEDVARPQ